MFNEFREILEYAIEAARQVGDLDREGFFSYWLGWLAPLQEQREEGQALLERAEAIALQIANHRLLADVYYTQANGLLAHSEPTHADFAQAETFLRQSLAISTERDFFQVQSMAASRLGQIIGERGEYAQSLELLAVAEEAARRIDWQRGLAWALYRRGCVKFAMQAFDEAKALFQQSLEIIEPWNEQYLIVDNKYVLAKVYAATGDIGVATMLAQEAHMIFNRLGTLKKKRLLEALLASFAT